MKKNKRAEYIKKMRETIINDLNDGINYVSIALSIGISISYLRNWMIENNLKDLYGEPISENKNNL